MSDKKMDKIVDIGKDITILGNSGCSICGRPLPQLRYIDCLFFCEECNEFRKHYTDKMTIQELVIERQLSAI